MLPPRNEDLLSLTPRSLKLDFETCLIARNGLIRNHLDAVTVGNSKVCG